MSKVLLIEDVASSANLARKILAANGHEVIIATNGEEAIHHARENEFDIVILDLGLPDVDGQTLVGILRNEYQMGDKPIIVCTAWPPDTAKAMVDAYGFSDFICKPYQVLNFMEVINRYLVPRDI